jgi:hypothetical protein
MNDKVKYISEWLFHCEIMWWMTFTMIAFLPIKIEKVQAVLRLVSWVSSQEHKELVNAVEKQICLWIRNAEY